MAAAPSKGAPTPPWDEAAADAAVNAPPRRAPEPFMANMANMPRCASCGAFGVALPLRAGTCAHCERTADAAVNAPPRFTPSEDLFFKVMCAAAREGYGREVAPAGDACASARAEEDLWGGIARAAFGAGQRTRLMAAAARGDAARLRFLLRRRAPLHACDEAPPDFSEHSLGRASGRTALLWAAANGHAECVDELLDACEAEAARRASFRGRGGAAGAGAGAVDATGASALTLAARGGHVGVIAALLARGFDVDARDSVGRTALYHAARDGQAAAVAKLLEAGAAAEAVRDDGWSAVLLAVQEGHGDIAARLAAAGADLSRTMPDIGTALHIAAYHGHAHVLSALVDGDIAGGERLDVLARDSDGRIPICVARNGASASALLFSHGGAHLAAQLRSRDDEENTLLHAVRSCAQFSGDADERPGRAACSCASRISAIAGAASAALKPLLAARNAAGDTPLLRAAARCPRAVEALLHVGADARAQRCGTMGGQTALSMLTSVERYASFHEKEAVGSAVHALMAAGADVRAVWASEHTRWTDSAHAACARDSALLTAVRRDADVVAAALLSAGAGRSSWRPSARFWQSFPYFDRWRPRLVQALPIAPPSVLDIARSDAVVVAALAAGVRVTQRSFVCVVGNGCGRIGVRALLRAGARPSRAAFLAALENGRVDAVHTLAGTGDKSCKILPADLIFLCSDTGLHRRMRRRGEGRLDNAATLAEWLCDKGCDVTAAFDSPLMNIAASTALHELASVDADAARERFTVRRLVARGASVHARDALGLTPLARAALLSSLEAVREWMALEAASPPPPPGAEHAVCRAHSGGSPLALAAFAGRADVVRALLERGAAAPPAARRPPPFPALHAAAARGSAEMVAALLDAGADARAVDAHGATPLHWLFYGARARKAEVESDVVVALLRGGASAVAADAASSSPLHCAARAGHCGGAREVVVAAAASGGGAALSARDSLGNTP